MNFEQQGPSPIQQIFDPELEKKGIALFIKRDDLLHPLVSGNKWRKLKYNLEQAKREGATTILTFGGAYSNHLHALAAAGKITGFKTIGLVRGEESSELNPTMKFALSSGMDIHYIDRETYRQKEEDAYLEKLKNKFGNFYYLPEGGTNEYAVKGCGEIISEIEIDYNTICCPCGSGGTVAGLAKASRQGHVLGICVLKGTGMLDEKVGSLIGSENQNNWHINYEYHFGGYAKMDAELLAFTYTFYQKHGIQIEPIYTGKMLFGIYDLIKKGNFKRGESIIALHTGGLQALQGLAPRMNKIAYN